MSEGNEVMQLSICNSRSVMMQFRCGSGFTYVRFAEVYSVDSHFFRGMLRLQKPVATDHLSYEARHGYILIG